MGDIELIRVLAEEVGRQHREYIVAREHLAEAVVALGDTAGIDLRDIADASMRTVKEEIAQRFSQSEDPRVQAAGKIVWLYGRQRGRR